MFGGIDIIGVINHYSWVTIIEINGKQNES